MLLFGERYWDGIVELVENVMEKLEKLELERDGTYILMSNIYFSANKRRNALKLRKAMKKRAIRRFMGVVLLNWMGWFMSSEGVTSHTRKLKIYIVYWTN